VNVRVVITADDRTGALETAGACADAGTGAVTVVVLAGPGADQSADGLRVVDLDSRHRSGPEAAAAAAETCDGQTRHLHKMDSTLRGNWAAEALAIARTRGERVLVVPALPGLGRVCEGGLVSVDGVLVHESPLADDPRTPVRSSRPSDHLRLAGAADVAELPDGDRLAGWLAGDGPAVAVCDAISDDDIGRIVSAWDAADPVVLVGTSAVVAEAARSPRIAPVGHVPPAPSFVTPVLVVCGSLHPAARAQVETLRRAGLSGVEVIASDVPVGGAVDAADAVRTAAALAMVVAVSDARTVVVLGGDTAAAILGDRPVVVGGTSMPGAPWMRLDDGRLVVTRAGGFGDPGALARHIADRIVS
jgi:uncharacterized protein YgbK (DUF1537 family)